MFNFLHRLVSNFYFRKPSVHYFQPKSLNLHFKSDLNNGFIWLNLESYQWVKPEVAQVIVNNNNIFLLNLNVEDKEGVKETLEVARFETRKEAETALNVLTNKMFSPEKSIIKFTLVVFLLVMLWGVLLDMINVLSYRMMMHSGQQVGLVQTTPVNPGAALTPEEQAKLMAEIQKNSAGNPTPAPSVVQDKPENPVVKNIIDGLGQK